VQFDRTEIVIRQRGQAELLDLTLRVLRRHGFKLAGATAVLGIPFIILNLLATSWMVREDALLAAEIFDDPMIYQRLRRGLHVLILFVLEFPLISLPATILLGSQTFFEPLTLRQVFGKLRLILWPTVWVLGVCRFALIALVVELFINRQTMFDPFAELFILAGFTIAILLRSSWPFAPEILGLEQCPLKSKSAKQIAYPLRRKSLHSGGGIDHLSRFIGCSFALAILAAMILGGVYSILNALAGGTALSTWYDNFVLPCTYWIVGVFAVVFRFLSYLDSRIRLEGWEIDLRLRAEGQRVLDSMVMPGTDGLPAPATIGSTNQANYSNKPSLSRPNLVQPTQGIPASPTTKVPT
jgi:hypothetical protein